LPPYFTLHEGRLNDLDVAEEGVLQGGAGSDPLVRLVDEEFVEQVDALLAQLGRVLAQAASGPVGKGALVVGELAHAGPALLVRSAQDAEDLEELVDLTVAFVHDSKQAQFLLRILTFTLLNFTL